MLADCNAASPELAEALRNWLRSHLIQPRKITVARKTDGGNTEQFWLVTDHIGTNDPSFRLLYDDVAKRYGIECTIQNDVSLFAGYRASLIEALIDIGGESSAAT